MKYFAGRKTFLAAALLVVLAGLKSQGYLSEEQFQLLNTVLVGLGFAALRLGMKKK